MRVPGHAVLRLMWRPATLPLLLVPLLPAVFVLAILSESVGSPVAAIWSGADAPEVRAAVWRLVILLPAGLGLLLGIYRIELQGSGLAHLLPGGRRDLAWTTALFAGAAAASALLLASRVSAALPAAAAAMLALLAFGAAGLLPDGGVARTVRWALALVLGVVVIRVSVLDSLLQAWPVPLLLLGAAGFAAVIATQQARRLDQRRFGRSEWLLDAPWVAGAVRGRIWDEPLRQAGLAGWIRAAAYESGMRFPATHVRHAALAALFVHLFAMPFMIAIMAGSFFSNAGMQLSWTLSYPLSRRQRRDLAFAGALLDNVTIHALTSVGVMLLGALGVPVLDWFAAEAGRPLPLLLMAGFGVALAPLVQFPVIRYAARGERGIPKILHLVCMLAYGVGTIAVTAALWRGPLGSAPLALVAIVFTTALVTHGVHWLLLHRFFSRADLACVR